MEFGKISRSLFCIAPLTGCAGRNRMNAPEATCFQSGCANFPTNRYNAEKNGTVKCGRTDGPASSWTVKA